MCMRLCIQTLPQIPLSCSSDEDPFSPQAIRKLIDRLEEKPIPHLTPKEHASLLVLIQTALEVSLVHWFDAGPTVCSPPQRSNNSVAPSIRMDCGISYPCVAFIFSTDVPQNQAPQLLWPMGPVLQHPVCAWNGAND